MRRTLLVCAAGAVLLAGTILLLVFRRSTAIDVDLRETLTELDSAISGGYLTTARETLASIEALPRSEADQLSLLKRAFQVSSGTGDYELLSEIAGKALSRSPRSRPIREIAAYASLRAGRVADAERLFGRAAPSGADGDSLRGEMLLRTGARWSGSDELTRELLALEGRGDPAGYSAAAIRADDKRLALDAALLDMQKGSADAAARIVRAELDDSRFDEAAALILYDAGDFWAAAQRMKRLDTQSPGKASTGLQIADAYAAGGRTEESEAWLRRTLPREPSLSWTPYANLALYAMRRGDTAGAARLVEDGRAFFPRSRELQLMQARLDIMMGDARSAEVFLSRLIADRPSDGEAALLLLALQGPTMSPEASRSRLWKLFERVPADIAVFDALASSLVAARDWDGMQIAVRQNRAAGGEDDARLLLLQGFAAAMSGDDEGAVGAFRRSSLLARDGIARFNIALVALRRGAARAALAELDGAAAEAKDSMVLSRIETLRGAARMLDGDLPGAGSALSRAIALDPHNLRAGLLMRKLEAGGQ